MLIFPRYFDGRPCSFRRSPEVLGSAGGAFWGVLGAHVWPTGALGEVLVERVWPTRALGEVLGDACARLEGPRGALETEFRDPKGSA